MHGRCPSDAHQETKVAFENPKAAAATEKCWSGSRVAQRNNCLRRSVSGFAAKTIAHGRASNPVQRSLHHALLTNYLDELEVPQVL